MNYNNAILFESKMVLGGRRICAVYCHTGPSGAVAESRLTSPAIGVNMTHTLTHKRQTAVFVRSTFESNTFPFDLFYGYFTLPLLVGVFYEVQNRQHQHQSTLLVNTSVAFIHLYTKPSRALYI
jgi:hypothetical protein